MRLGSHSPFLGLRQKLEFAAIRFATLAIPRIPRAAIPPFARIAGRIGYFVDHRGRQTSLENLEIAFGDRFSPAERRRIAVKSYQTFARTFLDLFWVPSLNAENVEQIITVELDDPACLELARNEGSIWITPHYGNFEWAAAVWGFRDVLHTIVAQNLKNPALTEVFQSLRSHSGATMIPQEKAMLRLFKHVRRKGNTALLPDLTVPPNQASTIIRCFGLKTSVSVLHAALAQRTGAAIFPGIGCSHDDGTCTVRIRKPVHFDESESLQEIAQRCWDIYEPMITERPEGWLWMYKHWRYLPEKTEGRAYPSYANRKKRFDKIDREITASKSAQT